jgi:hypothetical protein
VRGVGLVGVVVDLHRTWQPGGDSARGFSDPIEVGHQRAPIHHRDVAGTEPAIRPQGPQRDALKTRTEPKQESEPLARPLNPVDERRKRPRVVVGSDRTPRIQAVHTTRKTRYLRKHKST